MNFRVFIHAYNLRPQTLFPVVADTSSIPYECLPLAGTDTFKADAVIKDSVSLPLVNTSNVSKI